MSFVKVSRGFVLADMFLCEKRVLASSCPSVLPSVRMEKVGSHWVDFHEILYLRVLLKSVEKNSISLQSDNNVGTVHEHLRTFVTLPG